MKPVDNYSDERRRFRVLVGHSDLRMAHAYAQALEEAGYQANTVVSLEHAHEMARSDSFNVVVLDGRWVRHGLDGFAPLRAAAPAAMWLVTCPSDLLQMAVALLRFDVAELLIEPVTVNDLCEAVARLLERARQQHELARLRALVPLYQLSQAFMLDLHLADLLQRIVETAVEATGALRGSLMLIDEDRQELTIEAAVGMPPELVATARERVGRGIAGWVARTGMPLVINNEEDIPAFVRPSLRGGMAHSAVCLPLTVKGRIIGVINLTKTMGQQPFTRGDAEMLSVLAGQAAIAIENARLFEEMERAYEDLRKLDEMKSDFINVAAHELRTPVAVVLGYTTLLAEQMLGRGRGYSGAQVRETSPGLNSQAVNEYIEAILRNAQRLRELADNLLDLENLSNWQPGDEGLEVGPVPVCPLVESVISEFQPLAREQGLSLEMALGVPTLGATLELAACGLQAEQPARPEAVVVQADEVKTALILRNLLSNALKFTPSGGRVVMSVEPSEEEVVVAVADTGPGIPPERRRHIFRPFYQAEPSLTRSHSGLGLGLSIAQRLAELQRGRLWLEDRAGFGAVFCLALPRG